MANLTSSTSSSKKHLVLGITGSIAAARAADLASFLTQSNCCVDVILTRKACRFITPLTLASLTRRDVTTDDSAPLREGQPTHIWLADRANLVVVAPASAHFLAAYAQGLAHDELIATLLATRAPVILAPAMNGHMWEHPATQANVATLKARGVEFIGPDRGLLACGYEGAGRLWPIEPLAQHLLERLQQLSSS